MTLMIKVGFNGWFLERPETGSGQYSRKILEALAGKVEFKVLAPKIRRSSVDKSLLNFYKVWFENVLFPLFCLREQVNVAFVPYMGPPLFSPVPLVVTVHDLIPFLFPEYAYSPLVKLYNALVEKAVPRARFILADSVSTMRDVLNYLRVSKDKVKVVYPGVGGEFGPVEEKFRMEVLEKYGLKGRFFLYLGGFDRRKNIGLLLEAYKLFKEKFADEAPALVIAGKLPNRESPALINPLKIALEKGIEAHVRFIGWVTEEDKPALYSAAEAFLFPSLYEGFGFPPLEAMACGCPVLASSSSSLPEVLNDGALLLDPHNPEEWAAGMTKVLVEPALVQTLRERGLRRAREFSWETTALKVISILEEVAGYGNL